ncbi:hypothetical protein [Falsiroseomonas sp.]|jgi:hypothetical protein|uniref:hypothetical protein n=1 Tax=Falsiroseomonas sp. TaxID=2870721 RepID=UPI0034A45668
MDPLTRIFIQLARWFRNPPSRTHVIVILIALGASVALVLVERGIGWPDWLRSDPVPVLRR